MRAEAEVNKPWRPHAIGSAERRLVSDFVPQLSYSLDADPFAVLLMAVDGKQEVGDQAGKDLHQ